MSALGKQPLWNRVALVGVGLLGASLGLALRTRGVCRQVVGVGRKGSASLSVALERGAIDEAVTDLAAGVREAELVVLCVPVGQFDGMLQAMAPVLKTGAVVTDVGSTKAQVMAAAARRLGPGVTFVGSHPMAGSEKRGPEAARVDLYENALCLLVAAGAEHGEAERRVEALWQAVGMRTLWVDAAAHDRWVAAISHLPHAAAGCIVTAAARTPEAFAAAATGFLDTTRVASGDLDMWTDIFMSNGPAVTATLDALSEEIAAFRHAVATGDAAAIRKHLAEAKAIRDELLARRKNGGT